MTAKEYLSQAYRIDQRINSKLEQVCSLRELATKATSTLTGTPSTHTSHSMESIIAKMVDLEDEINRDIDALVDLKHEIVTAIKAVGNPEHQTLMELRYLCFNTWEEIAIKMGYSVRSVFRMHDAAVENINAPQSCQ